MEFKMMMGSFSIGKVIFDLDNIPFKKEGLIMGRLPSGDRIQIDYIKTQSNSNDIMDMNNPYSPYRQALEIQNQDIFGN